jgi:RNA polymerase sigma-70 factor (ECF subfamily)
MKKINLRDIYPHYRHDIFADVSCEIECILHKFDLLEAAYVRRVYRNKAHYSLDRNDGIEAAAIYAMLTPSEEYEHKEALSALYAAIASLPDKQAKRLYAHFFFDMSKAEIARAEGVNVRSVSESIERGLRNLKKILRKSL